MLEKRSSRPHRRLTKRSAKTVDFSRPASLVAKKQPLGILPTLWFWNDEANFRLARPFVLAQIWISLPLASYAYLHGVSFAVLLPTILGSYVLLMGGIERYVRHAVEQRRKRLSDGPPAPES